ncbi:hypothetical protein [Halobacteriaceae bacterium SHR40]|uniref:hypothetical protein n=1 Tax=Halovenus amylolytica TaxID=2500550 RepID=UPI000FE3E6BB
MGSETYPVSILNEGPAFSDEIEGTTQTIQAEFGGQPVESIYLVPTKSAAKGVYKIYFLPKDRQWALVRLARRYRWLLEIQLLRGMSGEQQLLGQDLTGEDLEFLLDIIPSPREDYSPVVYDMLWVAAAFDEYLELAKVMHGRSEFTPKEVVADADGVTVEEIGLFTKFLRRHLIEPVDNEPKKRHGPSSSQTVELSINPEESYKLTSEGENAIEGIVTEYERILVDQQFEPLFINPELNPLQHFEEYEPAADEMEPSVPDVDAESAEGILGEIAGEFSDAVPESEVPTDSNSSKESETISEQPSEADNLSPKASEENRSDSHRMGVRGEDKTETKKPDATSFTDDQILGGVEAAIDYIESENVAKADDIKSVVWNQGELNGRNRMEYWELVRDVLLQLDDVCGRPGGRVWTSATFTE